MNTLVDDIDAHALEAAWGELDRVARLRPIHDEASYEHAVALMNRVLDVMGDNEHHPLSGLLELLVTLVSNYEKIHYSLEEI
jgi:HTH-type transcriptional regulator/antitoxin HigA